MFHMVPGVLKFVFLQSGPLKYVGESYYKIINNEGWTYLKKK